MGANNNSATATPPVTITASATATPPATTTVTASATATVDDKKKVVKKVTTNRERSRLMNASLKRDKE